MIWALVPSVTHFIQICTFLHKGSCAEMCKYRKMRTNMCKHQSNKEGPRMNKKLEDGKNCLHFVIAEYNTFLRKLICPI